MAQPVTTSSSDYSRFAPKRFREQPPTPSEGRPYVPSAPTVPAPRTPSTERRAASDFPSWPEPVPEPPAPPHRLEDGPSALIGRVALVVTFAAVVALVLIFARPISQGAHALVDATSRLFGSSKSTDLLTASTASEFDRFARRAPHRLQWLHRSLPLCAQPAHPRQRTAGTCCGRTAGTDHCRAGVVRRAATLSVDARTTAWPGTLGSEGYGPRCLPTLKSASEFPRRSAARTRNSARICGWASKLHSVRRTPAAA